MFGRKGTGSSSGGAGGGQSRWQPVAQLIAALDETIALFTSAMLDAGLDCGSYASQARPTAGVEARLARSVIFTSETGPSFVSLGITKDFEAFSYEPHCNLFLILNAVGLLEDPRAAAMRRQLATSQVPEPFLHAVLLRSWLEFVEPTGAGMARHGQDELERIHAELKTALAAACQGLPRWLLERLPVQRILSEWRAGYPGVLSGPMTPAVKQLNGLPMRDFVFQTLSNYLSRMAASGATRAA